MNIFENMTTSELVNWIINYSTNMEAKLLAIEYERVANDIDIIADKIGMLVVRHDNEKEQKKIIVLLENLCSVS